MRIECPCRSCRRLRSFDLVFKAKAKIAAFGSSYTGAIECRVRRLEFLEGRNAKTRFRGFLGNSRS
ncbi:hypothetical protein C3E98_000815 [Pseudomonas sp. MWU13-2625]|nr:hypothetical protein C3E98_000815 [Pseudomonas sp. MWU13-2625]